MLELASDGARPERPAYFPRPLKLLVMLIMVAGPFRSGAGANDPAAADANLRVLSLAAIEVFDRGHVPLIAVHTALPLIQLAGEDRYAELMLPISLELADRCDGCLRIGGPSAGADKEVERFARLGRPVYGSVEEIPDGR